MSYYYEGRNCTTVDRSTRNHKSGNMDRCTSEIMKKKEDEWNKEQQLRKEIEQLQRDTMKKNTEVVALEKEYDDLQKEQKEIKTNILVAKSSTELTKLQLVRICDDTGLSSFVSSSSLHKDRKYVLGLQVEKVGKNSLLLKWTPPRCPDLKGYEIYVDSILHHRVRSKARYQALLENLDLSKNSVFSLYPVTSDGILDEPEHLLYMAEYEKRESISPTYDQKHKMKGKPYVDPDWLTSFTADSRTKLNTYLQPQYCVAYVTEGESSDESPSRIPSYIEKAGNNVEAMKKIVVQHDKEIKALRNEKEKLVREMEKLEERARRKSIDVLELRAEVLQLKKEHKLFEQYIEIAAAWSSRHPKFPESSTVAERFIQEMSLETKSTMPVKHTISEEGRSPVSEPLLVRKGSEEQVAEPESETEIREAGDADIGFEEKKLAADGQGQAPQTEATEAGPELPTEEESPEVKTEPLEIHTKYPEAEEISPEIATVPPDGDRLQSGQEYEIKFLREDNKKLRKEVELLQERANRKSLDITDLVRELKKLKSEHMRFQQFFLARAKSVAEESQQPAEKSEPEVVTKEQPVRLEVAESEPGAQDITGTQDTEPTEVLEFESDTVIKGVIELQETQPTEVVQSDQEAAIQDATEAQETETSEFLESRPEAVKQDVEGPQRTQSTKSVEPEPEAEIQGVTEPHQIEHTESVEPVETEREAEPPKVVESEESVTKEVTEPQEIDATEFEETEPASDDIIVISEEIEHKLEQETAYETPKAESLVTEEVIKTKEIGQAKTEDVEMEDQVFETQAMEPKMETAEFEHEIELETEPAAGTSLELRSSPARYKLGDDDAEIMKLRNENEMLRNEILELKTRARSKSMELTNLKADVEQLKRFQEYVMSEVINLDTLPPSDSIIEEPITMPQESEVIVAETETKKSETEDADSTMEMAPVVVGTSAEEYELDAGEVEKVPEEADTVAEEPNQILEEPISIYGESGGIPKKQEFIAENLVTVYGETEESSEEPEMVAEESETVAEESEDTLAEYEPTFDPELISEQSEESYEKPDIEELELELTSGEPETGDEGLELTSKEPEITVEEPEVSTEESKPSDKDSEPRKTEESVYPVQETEPITEEIKPAEELFENKGIPVIDLKSVQDLLKDNETLRQEIATLLTRADRKSMEVAGMKDDIQKMKTDHILFNEIIAGAEKSEIPQTLKVEVTSDEPHPEGVSPELFETAPEELEQRKEYAELSEEESEPAEESVTTGEETESEDEEPEVLPREVLQFKQPQTVSEQVEVVDETPDTAFVEQDAAVEGTEETQSSVRSPSHIALVKQNEKIRKEVKLLLERTERKSADETDLKTRIKALESDHKRFQRYITGEDKATDVSDEDLILRMSIERRSSSDFEPPVGKSPSYINVLRENERLRKDMKYLLQSADLSDLKTRLTRLKSEHEHFRTYMVGETTSATKPEGISDEKLLSKISLDHKTSAPSSEGIKEAKPKLTIKETHPSAEAIEPATEETELTTEQVDVSEQEAAVVELMSSGNVSETDVVTEEPETLAEEGDYTFSQPEDTFYGQHPTFLFLVKETEQLRKEIEVLRQRSDRKSVDLVEMQTEVDQLKSEHKRYHDFMSGIITPSAQPPVITEAFEPGVEETEVAEPEYQKAELVEPAAEEVDALEVPKEQEVEPVIENLESETEESGLEIEEVKLVSEVDEAENEGDQEIYDAEADFEEGEPMAEAVPEIDEGKSVEDEAEPEIEEVESDIQKVPEIDEGELVTEDTEPEIEALELEIEESKPVSEEGEPEIEAKPEIVETKLEFEEYEPMKEALPETEKVETDIEEAEQEIGKDDSVAEEAKPEIEEDEAVFQAELEIEKIEEAAEEAEIVTEKAKPETEKTEQAELEPAVEVVEPAVEVLKAMTEIVESAAEVIDTTAEVSAPEAGVTQTTAEAAKEAELLAPADEEGSRLAEAEIAPGAAEEVEPVAVTLEAEASETYFDVPQTGDILKVEKKEERETEAMERILDITLSPASSALFRKEVQELKERARIKSTEMMDVKRAIAELRSQHTRLETKVMEALGERAIVLLSPKPSTEMKISESEDAMKQEESGKETAFARETPPEDIPLSELPKTPPPSTLDVFPESQFVLSVEVEGTVAEVEAPTSVEAEDLIVGTSSESGVRQEEAMRGHELPDYDIEFEDNNVEGELTVQVIEKIEEEAYAREHPVEAPAEVRREEPTVAQVEVPIEESTEVLAEEPIEISVESPAEGAAGVLTEVPTEVPTEEADKVLSKILAEIPREIAIVTPRETAAVTPTDAAAEVSIAVPIEAPIQTSAEVPLELSRKAPTEAKTEKSTEGPAQVQTEVIAEGPMGALAEKSKQVLAEEPMEALAEESKEVLAEEPMEALAEESKEILAEEPMEALAEESKVQAEKSVEVPAEESIEAPAEEKIEAPTKEKIETPTAEEALEAPAEESIEAPAEMPIEAPAEEPIEAPAEEKIEAPTEERIETPAEEPIEAPAEEPIEAPAEEKIEAPTEERIETPAEEPIEAPAEEEIEPPAEEPIEAPTEEPIEAPTEEPIETPTEEKIEAPAKEEIEASSEEPIEALTEEVLEASTEEEIESPAEEPIDTLVEELTEAQAEVIKDEEARQSVEVVPKQLLSEEAPGEKLLIEIPEETVLTKVLAEDAPTDLRTEIVPGKLQAEVPFKDSEATEEFISITCLLEEEAIEEQEAAKPIKAEAVPAVIPKQLMKPQAPAKVAKPRVAKRKQTLEFEFSFEESASTQEEPGTITIEEEATMMETVRLPHKEALQETVREQMIKLQTLIKEKEDLEKEVFSLEQHATFELTEFVDVRMALSLVEVRSTQKEEQLREQEEMARRSSSTSSFGEPQEETLGIDKDVSYPAIPNTVSRLQSAIKLLKNKCLEKDRLIHAMADDLRARARSGIFENLLKDIKSIDSEAVVSALDFTAENLTKFLRSQHVLSSTPNTSVSISNAPNESTAGMGSVLTMKPDGELEITDLKSSNLE